jgi:hypothetical protein
MGDVILGILIFIGMIFGIPILAQWTANKTGRRQILKVNGATMFDVRPNNRPPTYISTPAANKTKPKNRKVYVYDPVSKTIEITYVE